MYGAMFALARTSLWGCVKHAGRRDWMDVSGQLHPLALLPGLRSSLCAW